MRILALDVGTSSVKAAVLDASTAQPLGLVAHAPYITLHPLPDAAEVEAEELWRAVTTAARQATRDFPEVQGVGLSVMTPCLMLLDQHDRPLGPIWTHLDRRARPAARQVWGAVGEEFFTAMGNRPVPGGFTAVCYRQQLHDDPYLCQRVRSYLHLNGWLAMRLTGERAFDLGNACMTGFFSAFTDRQWSQEWCDYFEVDRAWLPPVVAGSTTVGTIRAAVAVELGVTAGLPLKLGTVDTSSAMLAAGVTADDLLHTVGTTQVLAALTPRPTPSPRLVTRLFGVGEALMQAAHNPVGGVAVEWLRALCFREQSEAEFYEQTVLAATQRATRVSLDPPYLGGDRLEIEAARASFRDLTLTTDRLDLLAAVLQAMVLRHREALRHLGAGRSWRRIVMTGGAAPIVRRLLSDYDSAPIEMLEEGSLRGVARLFVG